MFKVKGIYKWQLVNIDNGKIDQQGEQENLITDGLIFASSESTYDWRINTNSQNLLWLSTTSTPLSANEYRQIGIADANIVKAVNSGWMNPGSWSYPDRSMTLVYNFGTPGSPRTVTIIGMDLRGDYNGWKYPGITSFIELTTSITQQTNQFLYVSYTMSFEFTGGLLGSPNNAYINDWFNTQFTRLAVLSYSKTINYSPQCYLTPFIEPLNKDNIMREMLSMDAFYSITGVTIANSNTGCKFGTTWLKSYISTEVVGVIGTPVFQYYNFDNSGGGYRCYGYSPTNLTPSVSRVYIHPEAHLDQIFSDPGNPPSSRGTLTLYGTPTNKFPIVSRLNITKAGDASDIVDETFTTDFNNDQLTVGQVWADDDIVHVSTTNLLPSPLAIDTNYYAIYVDDTHIKLSASEGGGVINITDNGTGTHTIARQISGRYRLELEPYLHGEDGVNDYLQVRQANSGLDATGEAKASDFDDLYTSNKIIADGGIREGDYCYTVQSDATGDYLNICRWYFNSVETSETRHAFGASGEQFWTWVRAKGTYEDHVYIATDNGIYDYGITSDSIPVIMTITGEGMVDNEVRDLSFDEITEDLWAGHPTGGLSKIDLSVNTATQYTRGGGNELDGLNDDQVNTHPGTLTAHDGKVLFGRLGAGGYVWLLDDGTGYCITGGNGDRIIGSIINKTDDSVVIRHNTTRWASFNITGITGPGTGSFSEIEHFDEGISTDGTNLGCQLIQLAPDIFLGSNITNPGNIYREAYQVGVGVISSVLYNHGATPYSYIWYDLYTNFPKYFTGDNKNPYDISEDNMGLYVIMSRSVIVSAAWGTPIPYGWTGGGWVKGHSGDRQIPKTGRHDLSHGISGAFDNAVGEPWDQQFVTGERFTYMMSPTLIKDNLQEYDVKVRSYFTPVVRVTNWNVTAEAIVYIPEGPTGPTGVTGDPDFRELDTESFVSTVYDLTATGELNWTGAASPITGEYYNTTGGYFEFNANEVGHDLQITYNYTKYM